MSTDEHMPPRRNGRPALTRREFRQQAGRGLAAASLLGSGLSGALAGCSVADGLGAPWAGGMRNADERLRFDPPIDGGCSSR